MIATLPSRGGGGGWGQHNRRRGGDLVSDVRIGRALLLINERWSSRSSVTPLRFLGVGVREAAVHVSPTWRGPFRLKVGGVLELRGRPRRVFPFDLGASGGSSPGRRSMCSPVKLLWLMMSQWGLFFTRQRTPPLSHLPFTLQTSIFP